MQQHEYDLQKNWRNQAATGWSLDKQYSAFMWKVAISSFPDLQDSTEALVRWDRKIKPLLIAYFFSHTSPKIIKIGSRTSAL